MYIAIFLKIVIVIIEIAIAIKGARFFAKVFNRQLTTWLIASPFRLLNLFMQSAKQLTPVQTNFAQVKCSFI